MSRVVFLDFDGVLHPNMSAPLAEGQPFLDAVIFGWVPRLARLLADHQDVGIVVHSTWRRTHDEDELRELLGPLGRRLIGVAPEGERYEAVQAWLARHAEVQDYCILDDEAADFPNPAPKQLILCNPHLGVTEERVVDSVKAWLDAAPPSGQRR